MPINQKKLIGSVGELVVIGELLEQGFTVGQYGYSDITKTAIEVFGRNIPQVSDYPLGNSCLKVVDPQTNYDSKWINWNVKPFNCTDEEINQVAGICRSLVPCEMARNGTPPCVRPKWLSDPKAWSDLYHSTETYNSRQYERTYFGYEHQFLCFERLNRIYGMRSGDKISFHTPFLRDNTRIHMYVENVAYKYAYTGLDMGLELTMDEYEEMSKLRSVYYKNLFDKNLLDLFKATGDPKDYDERHTPSRLIELLKKEKAFEDKKNKLYPYPGKSTDIVYRYDLACEKDGVCDVAIEVKTNQSKLKYGQLLRLNLLKHFGYEVYLAKVNIDKSDLNSLESVMMPRKFDLDFVDVPEIDLTQHLAEFDDMVNRIYLHRHHPSGVSGFIPNGLLSPDELRTLANPKSERL